MSKDDITKISGDGLRYKSKEGGSPFAASGTGASMSCYKCGLHNVYRVFAGSGHPTD